jgi:hypothetical protein
MKRAAKNPAANKVKQDRIVPSPCNDVETVKNLKSLSSLAFPKKLGNEIEENVFGYLMHRASERQR